MSGRRVKLRSVALRWRALSPVLRAVLWMTMTLAMFALMMVAVRGPVWTRLALCSLRAGGSSRTRRTLNSLRASGPSRTGRTLNSLRASGASRSSRPCASTARDQS